MKSIEYYMRFLKTLVKGKVEGNPNMFMLEENIKKLLLDHPYEIDGNELSLGLIKYLLESFEELKKIFS